MNEDFRLPGRANIDTAQDLLSLASAALAPDGEAQKIVLDAGDVEALDGLTTLALANMARTAAERGPKIAVKSPTSPFVDAFQDLGLYGDLMKMEFV